MAERLAGTEGKSVTQQQNELSAEDVIFGGGGIPSAKWETVGQWVGGPIRVKPRTYHAKEYVPGQAGAGRPLFKQNGEPVMGVRVDVVTGMRDPAVDYDDGTRRMHLDKWRQLEAVRRALTEAGADKLEAGGELWVQWTGEEADANGGQSAKTWNAKYRGPANGVSIPDNAPAQGHSQPPAAGGNYAYPGQPHQAAPGAVPATPGFATGQGPAPAWAQAGQNPAPDPTPAPVPSGPPAGHQAPQAAMPMPGPQAPVQPAAAPGPSNVITSSVAAALRAQGVDTSAFTIVPG